MARQRPRWTVSCRVLVVAFQTGAAMVESINTCRWTKHVLFADVVIWAFPAMIDSLQKPPEN
jgi:hypothetical protein